MLSLMFQIAGTLLLAIMTVLRNDNEHYKLLKVNIPIPGQVPEKLRDLYKETWLFRIGLFWILIGYFIQVLNFDVKFNLTTLAVAFVVFIGLTVLTLIGWALATCIAEYKFKHAKPFDPDKNPEDGDITIEI